VGYSTSHCFSNAIIGITRTHVHALGHIKIVQQDEKNFCLANMQWAISENTIIPVLLFVSPNFAYCKHCFQFLLGLTMVPRENKNNAYAKFRGTNKEYYGIFRSGLWIDARRQE